MRRSFFAIWQVRQAVVMLSGSYPLLLFTRSMLLYLTVSSRYRTREPLLRVVAICLMHEGPAPQYEHGLKI